MDDGRWMMEDVTLLKDVIEEGGEGDEDGGGAEPDGGGLADGGVAGLDLVGLHIDDVVLLEVIIWRIDDVGIVEVERDDILAALGILTNKLHLVTDTIDGQVAGLGQSLEDIDLLIADSEHAGLVDLTKHGDLVVGHADGDDGILGGIQIRQKLVVDHLLTLGLGESTHSEGPEHREIDVPAVVHQIGLQGALRTNRLRTITSVQRRRNDEVIGG